MRATTIRALDYWLGVPACALLTLVRRLSRLLHLPVRSFDCAGGCHGTLTDWHNRHLPGRAVTIELGPRVSTTEVARDARGLLQVATP